MARRQTIGQNIEINERQKSRYPSFSAKPAAASHPRTSEKNRGAAMKIDSGKLERLKFLARVIEKESHHLTVSLGRVFKEPFTVERAKATYSDEDLSDSLEAFTSRFARLQDTLGDKLIPQLLNAMGEKQASVIDNLDKAERFGWIVSADEWLAIRDLRNQILISSRCDYSAHAQI
jgi:hypothetical protein